MKLHINSNSVIKVMCLWFLLIICACSSGPVINIHQPQVKPPEASGKFMAGAFAVDITPPPGFPLFGHSWEAAKKATGYSMRLKSRAIVLQDSNGQRVALVQLDLGAASRLLHRKVARRLAPLGFGPENLLMAASHTHAAQGGIFGSAFYNKVGSGRSGFYPQLVDWLVERIAYSVERAVSGMVDARIAAGSVLVKELSRNRSHRAWEANYENTADAPYQYLIPEVFVLRVDRLVNEATGESQPLAAWVVAPVHATADSHKCKVYHGDLFGAAARFLAADIQRECNTAKPFVTAVCAGPQGDVSPVFGHRVDAPFQKVDKSLQGPCLVRDMGRLLANAAGKLFRTLNNDLQAVPIKFAYSEVVLQDNKNPLCYDPIVGAPVLGGAEDGRSKIHNFLGAKEGNAVKKPKGCQQAKKKALSFMFNRLVLNPKFLPKTAAFQVINLGDVLTLAAFPVEITTESGFRIGKAINSVLKTPRLALIAMANGYMSYLTTRQEYAKQHYEGGSTLYGPNQEEFFRQQARLVTNGLSGTSPVPGENPWNLKLLPGRSTTIYKNGKTCRPTEWSPLDTLPVYDDSDKLESVSFIWKGLKKKTNFDFLPSISIQHQVNGQWIPLVNPQEVEESDEWLNFIVTRKGNNRWTAKWTPVKDTPKGTFRIKVNRPGKALYSDLFRSVETKD
ncbi:MAG: hypothetical protein GY757_03335 [bacterium]|nr:hypothetical protein [bacterium]